MNSKKEIWKAIGWMSVGLTMLATTIPLSIYCIIKKEYDGAMSLTVALPYYPIFYYGLVKLISLIKKQEFSPFWSLTSKSALISYGIFTTLIMLFYIFLLIFAAWYFIFGILFCAVVYGFVLFVLKSVFNTKLKKTQFKTKRFLSRTKVDSYYINGVDIFNDNNREKMEGCQVELISPYVKEVIANTKMVYKIKGVNFQFFVAIHTYPNGVKLIYLLGHWDNYKIFMYNINSMLRDDYEQNFIIECDYCKKQIENEIKENERYSQNYFKRASIEQKETIAVKIDYRSYIEFFDDRDNESTPEQIKERRLEYTSDKMECVWIEECFKSFETMKEAEEFIQSYFEAEEQV